MISEDLSIAYYHDSQHLLNQHHPVFPMNLFFFISLMVAWKKSTDVEHHICSFFQTEGIGKRRSYFKILITTHRHSIRQTILEFMSRIRSIEEDVLYDLQQYQTHLQIFTHNQMHPLNETHELPIAIEKEQVPPTISKQIIWGTPSDIVSFPNLLENFVSVINSRQFILDNIWIDDEKST